MIELDWEKLSAENFEHFCFDLLSAIGFVNVQWRLGGADRGRDLQADWYQSEPGDTVHFQKWFVECKRYLSSGVPVGELTEKIAWADACNPDYLLIITNNHLTPAAKDWLSSIAQGKPYQIRVWEGDRLQLLLKKFPDLVTVYFNTPQISGDTLTPIKRRLESDHQDVCHLVDRSRRKIEIERTVGHPPRIYVLRFNCKTISGLHDDKAVYTDITRVKIMLPKEYPRLSARAQVMSPVFHPQVTPHFVCSGWNSSLGGLDKFIMGIFQILSCHNYDLHTPVNDYAAKWFSQNSEIIQELITLNTDGDDWLPLPYIMEV